MTLFNAVALARALHDREGVPLIFAAKQASEHYGVPRNAISRLAGEAIEGVKLARQWRARQAPSGLRDE